jgi:PAS domain S-box-containing protein
MDLPYRQYFDAMPCYVTVQDRNFRVVAANSRFKKDFGDYTNRYCYQVYKHRPEKCEVCPVERTFQDGQSHRSEERVRCLDGKEVSVIVYTEPIRDDDGNISAVMEMSTDITDIKRLEHQLRDSQERYHTLFEEVPCYISIQDRDLNIVDANRQHREEFGSYFGCKCFEVYKHRDEECYPCTVRQTFQDGEIRIHEEVVTSKDGEPINVLVHTSPIHDASGGIKHVMEMSANITQIRELESKLTSIGLLISSISHGIKGLLNGLNGGIYLVNNGLAKDNRARIEKGWEIVVRNITRIRSMVLDILYYAKDREPDWETLSAPALLAEATELTSEKARDLSVELKTEIDDQTGEFEADHNAMRSLLVNLIENSLDACRIDQKKDYHAVKLRTWGSPQSVHFGIEDNGIGMDRETRDKAFSLFFSSKGSEGTGLGLFIANKIAVAHGGQIQLDSKLDRGTSFTVSIPRKRLTPEQLQGNPTSHRKSAIVE